MLFYCSFATVIVLWVPMEIGRRRHHQFLLPNESIKKNRESPHLPISMADVETSLFYVFLCFAAFFGTGNIASISSFEIASTYRFTTIFDPFLMGALLLWKVVIPFLCVACIFQVIQRLLHIPESASLFIMVAFSDVMALNFFFLVKNSGSWRDIGTSISHFIVANSFVIAQLLLFGAAKIILRNAVLFESDEKSK